MMHRLPANSESLREAFPEVYREFFARCDIVVSAPGSFYWSAGLAVIFGGTGLVQKLPLTVYVGFEQTDAGGLTMGTYSVFLPSQQKFSRVSYDRLVEQRFLKLLSTTAATLIGRNRSGKIHILSEVPRGAGLNVSGASMISLSVLLHLLAGRLTVVDLIKLTTCDSQSLVKDPTFDAIFRLAWKYEALFHSDAGSGTAPFAAFVQSESPVVFFSERRRGTHDQHPFSRVPSDVLGHYEVFDQIAYSGQRLSELAGWKTTPTWPIDFALIYTGVPKQTLNLVRPLKAARDNTLIVEEFIAKHLNHFPDDSEMLPTFMKMTVSSGNKGLWEKSLDILIALSVKAVYDMKIMLERGSDNDIQEFMRTSLIQEEIAAFYNNTIPSLQSLIYLADLPNRSGQTVIRMAAKSIGKGGDIVLAAPLGQLPQQIDDVLAHLKAEYNQNVALDHASWLDGQTERGVRVEQWLDQDIYSPFVTHRAVVVTSWRPGGQAHRKVFTAEEFERIKPETDIILDEANHRIYLRGQPLTSHHLYSAKMTISILRQLLARAGQEVAAADLPPSTYIERNEMQSKIVTPLTQVVKQYTGKALDFKVSGGLRKDFRLKFSPGPLTIRVIERES